MDPDRALQEPLLQLQTPASESRTEATQPPAHDGAPDELRVVFEESVVIEARGGWSEARRLVQLAVPLSASEVLSYLGFLIVLGQLGRLGAQELSAVALGSTFFNITGLSLVIGMSSGMYTFCGQAYGAGNAKLMGIILQRAMLLCWLTALPLLAAWVFAPKVLVALGQDPQLVQLAVQYVWAKSPLLLLSGSLACCQAYLSSQSVVLPLTVISGIITAATPLMNLLFTFRLGLGVAGAGLAAVVADSLGLLLAVAFIWRVNRSAGPGREPWGGWSRQSLQQWAPYLQVALPSTAMICLDWWTFETLTLLAGWLPNAGAAVGAMGVCFGIHVIVYFLIAGVGEAVTIRVSNQLGASLPSGARKSMLVGTALAAAAAIATCVPLVLLRGFWASLFTRDAEVRGIVTSCLPYLALSLLADSINTVMSKVINGAGRQATGWVINLVTFWLVGLPLAGVLALKLGMGAVGLWRGMAASSVLQAVVMATIVCSFDWKRESDRASGRVRQQAGL